MLSYPPGPYGAIFTIASLLLGATQLGWDLADVRLIAFLAVRPFRMIGLPIDNCVGFEGLLEFHYGVVLALSRPVLEGHPIIGILLYCQAYSAPVTYLWSRLRCTCTATRQPFSHGVKLLICERCPLAFGTVSHSCLRCPTALSSRGTPS